MTLFKRINTSGTFEVDGPAKEKIISGKPVFKTWNIEETPGGIYCGIWECTPGKWKIQYDEWEFCHILSGISLITGADGTTHALKAGDSFILRPGFSGTWEVIETTRKEYVIKL